MPQMPEEVPGPVGGFLYTQGVINGLAEGDDL